MKNFITEEIDKDLSEGKYSKILTRFPPEPNGHLHLGHAKSIHTNFEIAKKYGGSCNLRLDDTNPIKENEDYVKNIIEDIRWLGYEPSYVSYASDYFNIIYEAAIEFIKEGKAYVCDLPPHEVREYRGTLTEPGKNSPWRIRTIENNIHLFKKMVMGEHEGTLRAKIDMASPNMNMRDPILYRVIRGANHHRTGYSWNIYPSYDFAHPICDAIEKISHSLCTLEFENHRPLYNWVVDNFVKTGPKPRQIEFSKLVITGHTMSKRKLGERIANGELEGWGDPRILTIAGLRHKGYTPDSIKEFCSKMGVSKYEGEVDIGRLENEIRDELNKIARRIMVVHDPILVKLTNYDKEEETVEVENNNEFPEMGNRMVPFSGEILVDKEDYAAEPPKKWKRLTVGSEVRLKRACIIKCDGAILDDAKLTLNCTWDPDTAKKIKGATIGWVSAKHRKPITVVDGNTYSTMLMEPVFIPLGERVQFLRKGYFFHFKEGYFIKIADLKSSFKG